MRARVEDEIVRWLFSLRPVAEEEAVRPMVAAAPRRQTQLTLNNPGAEAIPAFAGARQARAENALPDAPTPARTGGDDSRKPVRRDEPKVGRNDPCPCGSGKKYKRCHGLAA
jgi:uncharacterized protein YecA (UPF0149 family)